MALEMLIGMLGDFVWGPGMLACIFLLGLMLTAGTGCVQIRHFGHMMRTCLGSMFKKSDATGGITPAQAVSTALAGTMGTGNIAGVATALVAGGPGAVFWMWLSALLGMAVKYAEVLLAVKYRVRGQGADGLPEYRGGPMYYIEKGLGSRWLACTFAALCALASLGIGNMSQANSVAEGLYSAFGVPALLSGLAVALVVGLVVIGGVRRIGAVAEAVIPPVSIIYIVAAVVAVAHSRAQLPAALGAIFSGAFSLRAAAGGVAGYGVLRAMRFGVARGVFSNEAGLGSAPIAHACAVTDSPVKQAFWGVFEVFADTMVCCTLTTLVILTAQGGTLLGGAAQAQLNGAALTSAAFADTFGAAAGGFVAVAMVFYAITAMLGWYLYGERSICYLVGGDGGRLRGVYRAVFLCCCVLGACGELGAVWQLSDVFNGLMAIPNLIALLCLSPVVFEATERHFKAIPLKKRGARSAPAR